MAKLRYSEFKDRIDIDQLETALGFIPITQTHDNDIGHCIFPENHQHGDTTGKFSIHRDKKVYNCWVCGGGSLLSLAMESQGLDVDQATAWLYQFTFGVDHRSDTEFHDYLLDLLADVEERADVMPYFNQRVLERFEPFNKYFLSRGINQSVIDRYHLCGGLHVMKAAPLRGSERIKTDDDYFGPVAIFPHYWQGRLVGWQHRWMEWDDQHTKTPKWLAKYTNTTDFPKATTLFNYDRALEYAEPVVVLESVPSVLFLESNNVPAVSYFGGATIKDQQLRLLRRFHQGVILAPDNDQTGDRFVISATQYLERYIPVFHAEPVQLGPKADLGDYAKTDDPVNNLRQHLAEHVHLSGVEI